MCIFFYRYTSNLFLWLGYMAGYCFNLRKHWQIHTLCFEMSRVKVCQVPSFAKHFTGCNSRPYVAKLPGLVLVARAVRERGRQPGFEVGCLEVEVWDQWFFNVFNKFLVLRMPWNPMNTGIYFGRDPMTSKSS